MLKGKVHTAHPVYYVTDLARSMAFYRDKLGLEVAWEVPESKLAAVQINIGAMLVLAENPSLARGDAAPVFMLDIDDVDSAAAALKKLGVKLEGEPSDVFYGRAVELKDPDGYRLRLASEKRK
jgi:predicted enzyme related to lactoylglutathione lyase